MNPFTPQFSLPVITTTTSDQPFDLSNEFGSIVRLCAKSSNTEPIWISFGTEDSTVVIPTSERENSMPLLGGAIEVFSINPKMCWIHVLSETGAQDLYVTIGSGS